MLQVQKKNVDLFGADECAHGFYACLNGRSPTQTVRAVNKEGGHAGSPLQEEVDLRVALKILRWQNADLQREADRLVGWA